MENGDQAFQGLSGMEGRDIRIDLGAVQETLVIPLWARAKEATKGNPIVYDPYSKDIVARIAYDFSKIEAEQRDHQKVWAIRAYNFDVIVKEFLAQNRDAVVINIGAGLDTTFQRVDNGVVLWINIDLPEVVALRQKLIPDSEREMTIGKSVFDFTWTDDTAQQTKGRSIMFMAAGVLCYFENGEVENLFRKLAERYLSAHIIFDAMSRFTVWGANRAILKKSGMESSALLKWHLKRATYLKKWVRTIRVIEDYPILSRLPARHDLSRREVWGLKIVDLFRLYKMVHVQFKD
jgi:O-methyltransferase involved in polyketide biosynthesis